MKKHQEGYVLVYVMVALVLLSLLGAVSCSIAVDNLKVQRSSIERMQDEYAAEALVEQTRATLNGYTYSGGNDGTKFDTPTAAQSDATTKFKAYLNTIADDLKSAEGEDPPLKVDWDDAEITWGEVSDNKYTTTVELELTAGQPNSTVAVETTVELTLTLTLTAHYGETLDNGDGTFTTPFIGYTYTVTVGEPKYTSFAHTAADANDETPANAEAAAETNAQTPAAISYDEAGTSIKKICENVAGEYGDSRSLSYSEYDAKTEAFAAFEGKISDAASKKLVTVVWPTDWKNDAAWNKTDPSGYKMTTLLLELTDVRKNIKATAEIKLTRRLIEHDGINEVSESSVTGGTIYHACTITASAPTIKSVTTS